MSKRSFKERFQYRFDNFFARGGAAIFLGLIALYAVALAVMGGVRLLVNFAADGNWNQAGEHLWNALMQILDIGGMEQDENSPFYNKLIGVTTAILGLTLISSMLAFVTSMFKEKLEDLRKGKSAVIEEGHTLILGFGIRSLEIIRELIEANDSQPDAAVVVLSDHDKEVMDDFFNDALHHRGPTRIITRSGNISSPLFLKRMGLAQCKSVILLNQAQAADSLSVKAHADYKVLKTIMAILAACDEGRTPPVVAQLYFPRNRELALEISPGDVLVLDEDVILSKILVQTSRQPGLSLVYSDLVGFVGNEVYFSSPPAWMLGKTFAQAQFHFRQSMPLGLRTAQGAIELNPEPNRQLAAGDDLIVLAEDDSTIVYHSEAQHRPRELALSKLHGETRQERFLIVGWSKKSPILIAEYASYLAKNSGIDIVVERLTEGIQKSFEQVSSAHPHIKMTLAPVNTGAKSFPKSLNPTQYDDVIILAGEGANVDQIDSETISILLKFRQYFKRLEQETGQPVATQLISEVMDSENVEIIQQTGVKDFLISNQFVSKIMAQLSEDPAVNDVYEDLFRAEGSEIYLKPLPLYLESWVNPVCFGDLVFAAQARGEVCFGVRLQAEQDNAEAGFGVYIIPHKQQAFTLGEQDKLIVLAKDEA